MIPEAAIRREEVERNTGESHVGPVQAGWHVHFRPAASSSQLDECVLHGEDLQVGLSCAKKKVTKKEKRKKKKEKRKKNK